MTTLFTTQLEEFRATPPALTSPARDVSEVIVYSRVRHILSVITRVDSCVKDCGSVTSTTPRTLAEHPDVTLHVDICQLTSETATPCDALRCWKCDSSYDPMCGDPFNTTHRTLIDCESERSQSSYAANHAYCKKTKESENNRQSLISRACVWANEGSKNTICSSPSSPYRKQEHCSICETDGCNGSPGTMVPSLISCLAPAMLWFVIKGR
uniref:(California timema) hypothetical protein n=1 Tax=Timema californicum TaxID=61474 RepID=A0A7R9J8I0_TIMCA|nr:unnamed protein product [Timema californicum]